MPEIGTTIDTVTVYTDRARVSRTGTVRLAPGSHRLRISELPEKLDAASVRASARGTARASLLGVDVKREFYIETPAERVRELDAAIERLEEEGLRLDARVRILDQEQTVLGRLADQTEAYARGLAFGRMKAETYSDLLDRFRERAEELSTSLLDLGVKRRDVDRRLEKLRSDRDQLAGARGRQRYTAAIDLEVHEEGEFSVGLEYVVFEAGWRSLYDIRLLESGQKVALELSYLAQVNQRTGEDWEGVALTLSTARPALTRTLPELKPWYVGPPRVRPVLRPQMARTAATLAGAPGPTPVMDLGADSESGVPPEDEDEVEQVLAKVGSTGATVTYRIPGEADVPTDGSRRKVAVARLELSPSLDYVSAPKLAEAVYRRAKVVNDSLYTLLPGSVSLFAGDEFLGSTKLDLTPPQGGVELYLGTDDRISVARELKRRDVDRRLIGDKRRARYGYELTVENLGPVRASVTLHDQVPVSRHEEVKVRLEASDPSPDVQTELNLLRWRLALEPTEKKVLRFDFVVEYPRAMKLTGLP